MYKDVLVDVIKAYLRMVFPNAEFSFRKYTLENTGHTRQRFMADNLVHIDAAHSDKINHSHITLRLLDESMRKDIIEHVKAACGEYVQTKDGRELFDYYCGCFHWDDFVQNVPNWICRKHGFEVIECHENEIRVELDEMMVDF